MRSLVVFIVFLLLISPVFSIDHTSKEFPLDIKASCVQDEYQGSIAYVLQNTLDTSLALGRVSYADTERSQLSMILNGRIIDPTLYCDATVLEPGQQASCMISFDPTLRKSGTFRIFHNLGYLNTYSGEAIQSVLRFRLIHDGEKSRINQRFGCTQVTSSYWKE